MIFPLILVIDFMLFANAQSNAVNEGELIAAVLGSTAGLSLLFAAGLAFYKNNKKLKLINTKFNSKDLLQQDKLGNTALHYAAMRKDEEEVDKILSRVDKDVAMHIKNKEGKSPFDLFKEYLFYFESHPIEDKLSATTIREKVNAHKNPNLFPYLARSLMKDVREEDPLLWKDLINMKAKVTRKSAIDGMYPVHFAARNDINLVSNIFDLGADINVRNKKGETPFMMAIRDGNLKMANFILDEIKPEVNIRNHYGQNALLLLLATAKENKLDDKEVLNLVKKLNKQGLEWNSKDILGINAYDYAHYLENQDVIDYFDGKSAHRSYQGQHASQIPVFINIYDTDVIGETEGKLINSILGPIGLGVYHASLEVGMGNGAEYHYTGNIDVEHGDSIMSTRAAKRFHKKVHVGYLPFGTTKSEFEDNAEKIVEGMKVRYFDAGYDKMRHNCVSFAKDFHAAVSQKYGLDARLYPQEANRLANLYRPFSAPVK